MDEEEMRTRERKSTRGVYTVIILALLFFFSKLLYDLN